MIKIILWDVDGTLLDFEAAEEVAIAKLFDEFGIGICTESMMKRYKEINRGYWNRLEKGLVTREQVLVGRFKEFFTEIGADVSKAEAFNEAYQSALGETIAYCDNSLELVRSLKNRVQQYAVTNGTRVAQEKKLKLSGFGELMDGVFISENLGVDKPDIKFFEQVFAGIDCKDVSKDEILIVGDSLTSDIKGGMNAGIRTCWYNPHQSELKDGYKADYIISDLKEILAIS